MVVAVGGGLGLKYFSNDPDCVIRVVRINDDLFVVVGGAVVAVVDCSLCMRDEAMDCCVSTGGIWRFGRDLRLDMAVDVDEDSTSSSSVVSPLLWWSSLWSTTVLAAVVLLNRLEGGPYGLVVVVEIVVVALSGIIDVDTAVLPFFIFSLVVVVLLDETVMPVVVDGILLPVVIVAAQRSNVICNSCTKCCRMVSICNKITSRFVGCTLISIV